MSPGRALTSPLWPWGVSNALCLSCIHTAPLGRLLAGFREPMVTRIGQRPPELDAGLEVTCSFSEHLSRTCHLANPVLAVGKMGSAGCWSWISRGKVWSGSAVWPCVGRFSSLSISASVQWVSDGPRCHWRWERTVFAQCVPGGLCPGPWTPRGLGEMPEPAVPLSAETWLLRTLSVT